MGGGTEGGARHCWDHGRAVGSGVDGSHGHCCRLSSDSNRRGGKARHQHSRQSGDGSHCRASATAATSRQEHAAPATHTAEAR